MIAIIAFSVLFIVFCVLAFLSSKNWLLRHVFLMLGVFIMAMVFLIFAGMTLKTHKAWKSKYATLTSQLKNTEDKLVRLAEPISASDEEPSVPQLQSNLSRVVLERGRVWRGARVANIGENSVQLDMAAWGNSACVAANPDDEPLAPVPGEEGAGAAPAIEPFAISNKMVLHIFAEGPVTQLDGSQVTALFGDKPPAEQTRGPCSLPVAYLGQFVVSEVAENGLVVAPAQPLEQNQIDIMNQGFPLALYEVLPTDDHKTLSGMSEDMLRVLFEGVGGEFDREKLKTAIRNFSRDGAQAEPGDLDERALVKIRFTEDYQIPVDIDGEASDDDRTFDVRGRAIPNYLQQGQPSEFAAGDEAEFDSVTANQLVSEGKCELVDEPSRYNRPLRNYELLFRQGYGSISDVQAVIDETNAENGTLIAAAEQVRQQISYREEEKRKLEEDKVNFIGDTETIARFREMLARKRQTQLQELGRLYEYNNSLRAQLSGF